MAYELADIALGPDGDLLIENGKLVIIEGNAARKQCLTIALKHFRGEWYRDENAGTDYRGAIVGKASDIARRAEIRQRCLSVPGVVDVQRIDIKRDPKTRKVSIEVDAVAYDGTVIPTSI